MASVSIARARDRARAMAMGTTTTRSLIRARWDVFWFVVWFYATRALGGRATALERAFARGYSRVVVRSSAGGARGGGRGRRRSAAAERRRRDAGDECYVDGSVDLGKGRSGVGVWYSFGHELNFAGRTTRRSMDNNVVETIAAFAALSRHDVDEKVTIHSDSRWVCRAMERVCEGRLRELSGVNAVTVATAYVLRARRGRTVIQKVRAHVGGPHADNARADQLALVGSKASDEDASSAFIPFVWSSSSEGESGDGFWRAVRELWRRDVALGLARCVAGDEVVGNGCIDGAASWDDARKRSHRDAYANVRPMDRDERTLERPKPFSDDCSQTEVVALDCEMVGVGDGGLESMLAQVCVLNEHGNALYCSYSRAYKKVTDYRTHVSGILPRHVDSSAPEFAKVRADVAALIRGRIVVGHALENDFQALQLHHPRDDVRDTAVWRPLLRPPRFARPRKLRHLARDFCALRIQSGDAAHDPAEDALAALTVYRKFRENWEGQVASAKLGRRSTAPP